MRNDTHAVAKLKTDFEKLVEVGRRQDFKIAGQKLEALIALGAASRSDVEKFVSYVEGKVFSAKDFSPETRSFLADWAADVIESQAETIGPLGKTIREQINFCQTMVPAIKFIDSLIAGILVCEPRDILLRTALICAFTAESEPLSYTAVDLFAGCLDDELLNCIEQHAEFAAFLADTKIVKMEQEEILVGLKTI